LQAAELATQAHSGMAALDALAVEPAADQVLCAIAGSPGLASTLAAIRAGKRVLIANKEPLVMCGDLMMAEALRTGALVLPIDSEHNAIFQCLPATARCGATLPAGIAKLILTASGGPFRATALADLADITPAQAVRHPNWSMGQKISVDSATMMNKGLELIEAAVLYRLPEPQIEVVIHPESIIHSLVEYVDGSTLAQLGRPDMRVPIAHALAWPERWSSGVAGLNWQQLAQFHFEPVDPDRFPALGLARAALQAGGHAPNVLNAANEIAVAEFLAGRLRYLAIPELVAEVLEQSAAADLPRGKELPDALMVAAWAQKTAAASARRLHR
jgi:1-deoxy-D-xylulose-5-phosphate reductoisomerase